MNVKISRNDPCPCGSGKKYKKCCGENEAVSITHMLEGEIDDLQKKLIHFALDHYGEEIQDDFEDLEEVIMIQDEGEREFYQFVHAIWYSLFEILENGETIAERFIKMESGKIKRPKLRKILQTWTNARVMAGKIIRYEHNRLMIGDGFTSEVVEAVLTSTREEPFVEGSLFIGILLPYEHKHVFFPAPFDLLGVEPEQSYAFINISSLHAGYDSPQEYLTDYFIEIMNELPTVGMKIDADELEWTSPIYKEVAEIFQNQAEFLGDHQIIAEMGTILWFQFCQKREKRIQNPNIYAAALHYLVTAIAPMGTSYTQKELGEIYSVSANSISTAFGLIDHVLNDEINELIRMLNAGISDVQVNQDAPKLAAANKKDRAMELIYQAFDAEGIERKRLAEEAIELDPHCSDAFTIKAEFAESLEMASLLYERAMILGKIELGHEFLEENKGYFWGLVETRPFMRAKFNYAESLFQLGNLLEAIGEYEELLELNPNDNQGVRESLFIAYVVQGNLEKADKLLKQFKDGTAHGLYNQLLLEILQNGFTSKATKLLKEAKKQNKYVIPYLVGKKQLPSQQPDYYGFGDENEAIVYAKMHLQLWQRISGLKDWLK